jgi:hypothetical protein
MNKPIKLPPFSVPTGVGSTAINVDQLTFGTYTSKAWTSFPSLASAAAPLPVIGGTNMANFHSMADGDGGVAASPPLVASVSPYWGVKGYPIRLPRELILICDPTVFDTFVSTYGATLIAANVNINASRSLGNESGWANGGDPTNGTILNPFAPNLLHGVPPNGVDTVAVERSNFQDGLSPGYSLVNCTVGNNVANAFKGGQRLLVAATNMLAGLSFNSSYACFYGSPPNGYFGLPDTYLQRVALANHDKARAQQTDAYFDNILRVFHLFWPPLDYVAQTTPMAEWVVDFTALCAATGNCTVVNRGLQSFPGAAAALTVADIWGYVSSFFGL